MSGNSVEEYLEALYSFNEKGRLAKNSELAKRLKVAPPSVTQMVQKLAEEGLVEYEPYRGAFLTGKGTALAQKVVRKHRLLERFLHDVLGIGLDKVHEEACRMEHGLSDEAEAALCKVMDTPEVCPDDGMEIPPCPLEVDDCVECEVARVNFNSKLLTQLSYLKPGEEGDVAFVRGGSNACQRLLDMGLTKGTSVKVLKAAPFNGPIEVSVRGTSLALGRGLASRVFIQMNDNHNIKDRPHPHGPHH